MLVQRQDLTLSSAEALQQAFLMQRNRILPVAEDMVKQYSRLISFGPGSAGVFLTFFGRRDLLYVAEPVFAFLFRKGRAPAKLGRPERNKHAKNWRGHIK